MKIKFPVILLGGFTVTSAFTSMFTAEPEWNPASFERVRPCLRQALRWSTPSRPPSGSRAISCFAPPTLIFDAFRGDDSKIAAFADDCVRHQNGYQTVNNPPPGGRMTPGPQLPNPDTEQGRAQLNFSMMTCTQQIDGKTFAYMKHIRPRRGAMPDDPRGMLRPLTAGLNWCSARPSGPRSFRAASCAAGPRPA